MATAAPVLAQPVPAEVLERAIQRDPSQGPLVPFANAPGRLGRRVDAVRDHMALLGLLRDCKVEAYRPFEVHRYQRALRMRHGWWLRRLLTVLWAIIGVLAVSSLVAGIAFVYHYSNFAQTVWGYAILFGIPIFLIAQALGAISRRWTARWDRILIDDYTGLIPVTVLQTITELSAAADERGLRVNFHLDELTVRNDVLDPFAAISVGSALYHFGHWEEPKFDAPAAT